MRLLLVGNLSPKFHGQQLGNPEFKVTLMLWNQCLFLYMGTLSFPHFPANPSHLWNESSVWLTHWLVKALLERRWTLQTFGGIQSFFVSAGFWVFFCVWAPGEGQVMGESEWSSLAGGNATGRAWSCSLHVKSRYMPAGWGFFKDMFSCHVDLRINLSQNIES